ncbi:hypothetical protein SCUCBS95973_000677 [Sporothrix curviconia]|uniref:Uncharacterized protein n=1 Tax=Sporothrix curviconia TaxID=1260050 RepID=A0ABP0AS76_9PEZI
MAVPGFSQQPQFRGQSPQIDIHNKPVFDTAEDLKDYFKALAEFLDTNTQSITFGFAIDIQGGKLGTPAGRIYAMTIMAQPVRGGHMLVCTKKARAREDSEAWTNEIRELCKPHVVDLDVLGPSAFDVHGHMRRLTLRYILKSQSIPKIMWNPQNMAATLSKQFMIEMSLPTEDRSDIVAATVSTSTAVAAPPAAATSTDFGETPDSATSGDASEPGEAAASGKAVVSATASDEISASRAASGSAESSGSDEPSSSDETTVFDETPGPDVTYESDATSMSGDISEAFEAVEIFEATEAVEVAEEAEADKADKNSGPTGLDEAAGLLSLSEGVDRYFAKKVSFYNYVVPTVETERNFLRTFSHAMKAIFDARLTQAEPQTLTSAHIKYLIDCVEYLPTMHFIFMDQVNAETERAGSTLNAVAEGTSYRVRTRTAACVNGKPEDELAPESSIAEIFGEGMSHQN